jgi:hypothetical protein
MAPPAGSASPGWAESVERLVRWIPGLGRYHDREGLREADKQVRLYLAGLLAELPPPLEAAQRRLVAAGKLEQLLALDRIGRLVWTLADRVRFASYGFAGVFDLHKIREQELTALHQFDLGLLEAVPRLRERVEALAAAADTGDVSGPLAQAEAGLRDFERTLDERDRLARGL